MDGTAPEPQPTPTAQPLAMPVAAADQRSPAPGSAAAAAPEAAAGAAEMTVAVGATVRLVAAPSYLKTADPMPMLRPPDLVDADELGQVVGLRALEQLAVRFRRGTFLLERSQLEVVAR